VDLRKVGDEGGEMMGRGRWGCRVGNFSFWEGRAVGWGDDGVRRVGVEGGEMGV